MKAVILNSGGVDSLASILVIKQKWEDLELHSLYIDLQSTNRMVSKHAAKKIAEEFCETHNVIEMPDLSWPEKSIEKKMFPFQSALLATVGANYAKRIGAQVVLMGIDSVFHSEHYSRRLAAVFNETKSGQEDGVTPIFPLGSLSRKERLLIAKSHPLGPETVSCWQAIPCGVCGRCKERIEIGLDL